MVTKNFLKVSGASLGLLAIIVTISIAIFTYKQTQPDFVISIKSLEKTAHPGDILQEEITVKDIYKYNLYPVSLSASEQPNDVYVTFNPQQGEPKPSYAANVNISIGKNAVPGTYTLHFKGTGSTGIERTCFYKLNILSSAKETASQETTSAVIANIENKITSPQSNTKQPSPFIVSGTAKKPDNNRHLWILVNPLGSIGFWPQSEVNTGSDNIFTAQVFLGDGAEKFDIYLAETDASSHDSFAAYLKHGKETGKYPETPLPGSVNLLNKITVDK